MTDLTLAKKLLETGEKQTVLEFLKLVSRFWKGSKTENKTLATWIQQVCQNEVANFKRYVEYHYSNGRIAGMKVQTSYPA